MHPSLLDTTIRIPPRAQRYVERARLSEWLEQGVPAHRLTLVSAPAGYGKTTALAAWARETELPVAWVTAGPELAGPERLLRAILLAWAEIEPDIGRTTPAHLLAGTLPDLDAVLAGIVNLDREPGDHVAIVVDDAHTLDEPAVSEVLTPLLDHVPPWLHIVLAARGEPPLPVARYRARQYLFELHAADLAFSAEETARFLQDVQGIEPSAEAVTLLHDRLQGWAAGLQLVALTLPHLPPQPERFVVHGQHRFIADYLREEVLAHLPDEMRRFLLRTSITDRLCGSLCDAITGDSNGQRMLETLERHNLFVVPLDDERVWYRYHPLFAEFLADELKRWSPDEVTTLHRNAAAWYLDNDLEDPAFDHAIASGDLALTFDVLNRYGMAKLITGQYRLAQAWLEAVPAAWYVAEPELTLLRVALLLFTGRFEQAIAMLDTLERAIAGSGTASPRAKGRVTAVRCFIACERNEVDQAERFAEAALRLLPLSDGFFIESIFGALGDTYRRNARWSEARDNYLRSLQHVDTPSGKVQTISIFGALADLALRQGRLREAADHWRTALDQISGQRLWGAWPLPAIGWAHIRLGEILYEWNRLDAAHDHLEVGLEQARHGGDPRAMIAGTLLSARLALAIGDLDGAERHLDDAGRILASTEFPDWRSTLDRLQVTLWLASDHLRTAVTWADAAVESLETEPVPDTEPTWLALAHVLTESGDTTARQLARATLERVRERAAAEGRMSIEIESLALLAVARHRANDRAGALTALEHALRLAHPEGYIRTLVDLGRPMARLLQDARGRGVLPNVVGPLLDAFGDVPGAAGAVAMTEALSDREQEVLALIAAGLTNREIADTLFISPETVKKHTGSIYSKLGVRGRTQAVASARELGLLD
jgi:LuxR family maltose regulon positive regulatory protein